MRNTTASSTKKGPGRHHVDGTPHGKPPVSPKGVWLGQHTNPGKKPSTTDRERARAKLARHPVGIGHPPLAGISAQRGF